MATLSRILYGDVKVKSFDILPDEEEAPIPNPTEEPTGKVGWTATFLHKLLPDDYRWPRSSPPAVSTRDGNGSLRVVEHELTTLTDPLSVQGKRTRIYRGGEWCGGVGCFDAAV